MWKTTRFASVAASHRSCGCRRLYYLQKKDIDRFLETFDQYKREKSVA